MRPPSSSKRLLAAALLSVLVVGGVGLCQQGQRQDRDRERIQTVIIGKFASEMELTPEQAEQFFPRLRQFQDRLEAIQREERQTRMELSQLSQDPDADRAHLDELLRRRKSAGQEVADMKQAFLTDISGFLTPQQVSRCSILLDELPQRVRQFIRQKEREHGGQGNHHRSSGGQQPQSRGY